MTKKYDPENERLKRQYLIYKREAGQQSEESLDAIAKAIHRFDSYNGFKPFKAFHTQQAIGFKRHLAAQRNERTGEPLSASTQYSTLAALRAFFLWLASQPGFKSRIAYGDADYFNMSRGECRIARTRRARPAPSLEQVRDVISKMPSGSPIERRDRALVAFILLTGARDGAVASLQLGDVDMDAGQVEFDARHVRTKFSKTFVTCFFQVGEEVRAIVRDWVDYLRNELLWGPADPLFPTTSVEPGPDRQFMPAGLARAPWSTATPIRAIFKKAFTAAGHPYFPPHRLRNTLTDLGKRICQTPEEFKAWSQNLGHDDVMTTFMSYGEVSTARQAEIICELGKGPHESAEAMEHIRRAVAAMARNMPNIRG